MGGQQAVPHSIDVLFAPPVVTGLTALDAASDGNSACPGVCVRDGVGVATTQAAYKCIPCLSCAPPLPFVV